MNELKCKCIKESSWFIIDDSFGESSVIGGPFSFQVGNIYKYSMEETWSGKCFFVVHPKHGEERGTGFDEKRFFEHFEIIKQ